MKDIDDARPVAEPVGGGPVQAVGSETAVPVSVIMPVLNEERHLAEAVNHVLGQDYPGALELVLAVAPSKDKTEAIAERLAAADPRITVLANPSGHIPAALNMAVRASRHDVLIRVDAHALLPPGYIAAAVRALGDTGAVNVGGIMSAEGITPFQRAVAWAMTSPAGVGSAKYHTGGRPGPAASVYLGAYLRSAIEGVGGYDERYLRAEDWELNHRIREAGGLIWFQPELKVSYRPRATIRALGSQYFNYGRWRRVVARMHAGTINLRYLAPPVAVGLMLAGTLAGLAGLAARAAGADGWWTWLLVAGFGAPLVYLLGTSGVAAIAARSLDRRAAAMLPLVLATMHVSWGVGFLASPRRLVPNNDHPQPR
jgi:succinoglycan biosynthesis protein ExoA